MLCHRASLKAKFVLQFTGSVGRHLPQAESLCSALDSERKIRDKVPTGMQKIIYMLIHTLLRKIMMIIITKG